MVPPKADKVYVIMIDFTGTTWDSAIKNTFALEADIARLAKKSGSSIQFHQYKEPGTGTPPAVLLECSADFLEKVKCLPALAVVHDLQPGVKTIRRSDLPQIEPPQSQNIPKNKGPKI